MTKLDVFEFKLENPGRPILTGGVVRGELLLRLKKDVDIARIMVHLFGGGQVEFQDGQGATGSRSTTVCEDNETYIRLAQIVYAKSNPSAKKISRNELYKCPFEFHLPADLPSSFMTVVYYKLTAFLDCGGKSHEVTLPLVVINDLDLNKYSGRLHLAEPIDAWSPSRSKLDTGLVTARLVATKRGYGFGETIVLQIEIYNNSKAKLENLNACLVQKGILKAYSNSGAQFRRVQRLLVKHVSLGKLRQGERLTPEDIRIQVPWVVTSDMDKFTKLIEIEYYVQITSSTQMLSAVTGQPLSQVVCIGPDYRKSELVSVLLEEQIAIGVRALREPNGVGAVGLQTQQSQQTSSSLYPSLSTTPSAPPPDSSDLAMFTMVPTAPPSYDEALTHQKAPIEEAAGASSSGNGGDVAED
ncbi:hypothetical protein BOX15_Mlig013775g2 [Macrostomum lignano]|uniref:Arrestin C-terminal-like domain-containing protein n=2 Tax=Macrostomum lignano TaxID=282301 RepID=A0A267DN79_9PLAT|nr:hypothetical protein BOX15_Mlig013775g2 [Macrostomum lignano]